MSEKTLENFAKPEVAEERDLYDEELERFRTLVRDNLDEAMRRYGFTLYHSLIHPDRENRLALSDALLQLEISKQLGTKPRDEMDYFNEAWLAIAKEDWKLAIEQLRQAVSLAPDFCDAWFNLALCFERSGDAAQAREAWSKFLSLTENDEARKQVEAHLAELSAS